MSLFELIFVTGFAALAMVTGVVMWEGQKEGAGVRAELFVAADLAADFRRGYRCWNPAGETGAPAMMAALGRDVSLSEPTAWSASFGPDWMAVHFTSGDEAHRSALAYIGGYESGSKVTVEFPDADPLGPGRRVMMAVREGPTGC